MFAGIIAGITWAIETVVLGIALAMSPFATTEQAIFLAPFVRTFLHDLFSAIFATIYNGFRGELKNVWKAARTKDGMWVAIAATIGGPIGMTGYVMCVNYMGASIGAVASAIFPAIGAVLAYFFLKEKMKPQQWLFLVLTLVGVYGLSYSPDMQVSNFLLGILGAAMCSFGWGIEAVIIGKCMKGTEVTDEYALQIRQTTSALVYGIVLLPILGCFKGGIISGWKFAGSLFVDTGWLIPVVVIAALFATVSYLFYYKAIAQIGASKAMALNVTYTAWALVFGVILSAIQGAFALPSAMTIICALVVLVCGVLAATDAKDLLKKNEK